jgi:hypothetical protein
MATAKSRGQGPGTNTRGGVVSTMKPPFSGGANTGEQHDMSGTFDKGRSGGGNGLPTTVQADFGNNVKTPKPGFAASAPSKNLTD